MCQRFERSAQDICYSPGNKHPCSFSKLRTEDRGNREGLSHNQLSHPCINTEHIFKTTFYSILILNLESKPQTFKSQQELRSNLCHRVKPVLA